ncbi:threonine/serine ThrE exporter family protein [Thaumasiovibrio sp. DFM-14]|uniref:threonine/serine ThrE exporter family protein n=1 Tax=Thaumasiovibrio sp. DFM-14 TaxID=3384792 RepID=UPI0039A09289
MSEFSQPEEQRAISRVCVKAGQILLQHGAESALVVDLTRRLGIALGIDSVELSLSASSMVLTTLQNDHCITTARRCPDRGINMQMVTEVQRICISAEHGILDRRGVMEKLDRLKPMRYNRWLVLIMIGLSCAAFSRIAGGDLAVMALTFCASCCGMLVRQELAHRHFNPIVNFGVTAFVTTAVAAIGMRMNIGNEPFLVMASSVLMLVPGVPLINAASDMVKGFINMGIARWMMASLLTLSTCLGIVLAMNLFDVWGWGA